MVNGRIRGRHCCVHLLFIWGEQRLRYTARTSIDHLILTTLLEMGQTQSARDPIATDYHPTIVDIIQVKDLFTVVSHPLPIELVDQILDEAEYWAHSSVEVEDEDSVSISGNKMYMRTMPFALPGTEGDLKVAGTAYVGALYRRAGIGAVEVGRAKGMAWLPPRGRNLARKIAFQIESKDQGWSGEPHNHGSYRGSYTWFDAGVENVSPDPIRKKPIQWTSRMIRCNHDSIFPDHDHPPVEFFLKAPLEPPFLPPPTHIQRNVHAGKEWRTHIVEWHYLDSVEEGSVEAMDAEDKGRGWKSLDGSFVRGLNEGDCITLWMRARFSGWRCNIKRAKIDVYWAV